ncbi:MAG: prpB [Enterovirga sp.]|nr:prpB [Enterovirga sp.]
MSQAKALRALLQRPDMVVAPGAFDGIGARFVAQAGFEAIYMTGAGTAAAAGFPDFGLVTMGEMANNAGNMAQAAGIPVIADADTGYGNELNVTRTIREYEMRDVAALHIEDQVAPKRCGHLDDKEVISREDFRAKIRAAAAARRNPDFLIIARTDSRAVLGFEEAIARVNDALEAGADMAFVEAVQTPEEMAAVPKRVNGPCLLNIVRGGKTPDISIADAQALGYRLAILPGLLIGAAMEAYDAALKDLRESGMPPASSGGPKIREHFDRLGAREWAPLRTRFRDAERALPQAAE